MTRFCRLRLSDFPATVGGDMETGLRTAPKLPLANITLKSATSDGSIPSVAATVRLVEPSGNCGANPELVLCLGHFKHGSQRFECGMAR